MKSHVNERAIVLWGATSCVRIIQICDIGWCPMRSISNKLNFEEHGIDHHEHVTEHHWVVDKADAHQYLGSKGTLKLPGLSYAT
jgi:hypothetical protein